ncbi:MAG: hypothetical protein VX640_06695 [Pseudomonadota bacterium]|nr:hypothetical protein [Pseudomonadota bacterium]
MTGKDTNEAQEPAPAGGAGVPLAQAIGARNLIVIIVAMPLVFLAAVAAVIMLAGPPKERKARTASVAASPQDATAPLLLPEGGRIVAMTLDGDRLAVNVDAPGGGRIVVYDLRTGAVERIIPVRSE